MRNLSILPAVLLLVAGPSSAFASSCADEITTLEKRLDSAGATQVTGTVPASGTTARPSDKALDAQPNVKPSDPSTKASASGVEEARKLVAKARGEEQAGKAEACRETIMQAKQKAGALP